MKKDIRVYMIHPFTNNEEQLYRYMHISSVENLPYKFIWDDVEPQYLIASEHIYSSKKAWDTFVRLYDASNINIFYAGECIAPDLNIFDYAICFDRKLKFEDRVCRIPTRLFFEDKIFQRKNELEGDLIKTKKELNFKSGFCNFIYSNPNGHSRRKILFETVNNYKKVDSLGEYLNNTSYHKKAKREEGWRPVIRECIDLKRKYKFSIACENATYAGYTSEKILSSMEAHTVPIYWGNSLIGEDVNEKAFVNCHDYKTVDDLKDRIREIDEDDALWCDIVSQPWLTKEQEEREKLDTENYYKFLNNIFMQSEKDAKRVGAGFHPQNYKRWFFEY